MTLMTYYKLIEYIRSDVNDTLQFKMDMKLTTHNM